MGVPMNRIDRLTGIILLLQSHRMITAEQIAQHYEISVRTVYRDIAALGEAGVPIIAEAGHGYSLMRGYHVPPVMFTENEAAALFLSGEVTEQVADESLKEALRSALLKIRSVLPTERRDYLNRLSSAVGIRLPSPGSMEDCKQALMPLQQATVQQKCVALRYNAGRRGEITTRMVEPLGLVFYSRQWHLIGHCRLRDAVRDFRLDRMESWEVLADGFTRPDGFSVKDFLSEQIACQNLVPVLLHVRAEVMERVRMELFSAPISETELPGGWVRVEILSFSLDWTAAWLMGFGPMAEAVEPQALREKIHAAALSLASRYEEK